MARTISLATVVVALGWSQLAVADDPAALPRSNARADPSDGRSCHWLPPSRKRRLAESRVKCAACHHAPMPFWALGEADRHGYAIDKKYLADKIESLLGSKEKLLSSRIFPDPCEVPRTRGRRAED